MIGWSSTADALRSDSRMCPRSNIAVTTSANRNSPVIVKRGGEIILARPLWIMVLQAMKNSSSSEIAKNDAAEIATCLANGAWAAAYVLAGGALERVLVAYFATGPQSSPLAVGDLADACRHDERLMKHAADIATVLWGCRDVVGPDSAVRIDPGAMRISAAQAVCVFERVRKITAGHQRQPMSADQIAIRACNSDIDDASIRDLVMAAGAKELRRLLLSVIPADARTLFSIGDPNVAELLARLRNLFDMAFCLADEEIKNAVVTKFLAAIDDQGAAISVAQQAFFRPKYLQYFDGPARKRMLCHLLGRLQRELSSPPLDLIDGIEEFLFDDDDVLVWLQAAVIASLVGPAEKVRATREYAKRAYRAIGPVQRRIIEEKHAAVLRDCEREGNHGLAHLLRNLLDDWAETPAGIDQSGGQVHGRSQGSRDQVHCDH